MRKSDVKKRILFILSRYFSAFLFDSIKEDINLQNYIQNDESFLLFTIKIEDEIGIEFVPYLEYEELASINNLTEIICTSVSTNN